TDPGRRRRARPSRSRPRGARPPRRRGPIPRPGARAARGRRARPRRSSAPAPRALLLLARRRRRRAARGYARAFLLLDLGCCAVAAPVSIRWMAQPAEEPAVTRRWRRDRPDGSPHQVLLHARPCVRRDPVDEQARWEVDDERDE